ncbi:MAG: SGNH/GDSL hydrolase family protein [Gammaproteobacteria bacterium]|jgi:hypothetical protein
MLQRIFFSVLFGVSALAHSAAPQEAPLTRVLFVGNSYLYYNDSLHNHVERMAIERHPGVPSDSFGFKSATIGGARLMHHNLDWLLKPERIGSDRAFEAVIMQGGSFEPLTPDAREGFLDTAVRYAKKVRQSGAMPLLYMTHAYVPPHPAADKDMIKTVSQTYVEAGRAAKAQVIPVGLAYALSYQRRPDFSLHADFDGTHPNLRGTYLGACVVYLTLYDDDLDGVAYDYFGRLPKDEARYLQQIARETVARFTG